MIEDVKSIVSPMVSSIKELNSQIKNGELDPDFLLKLATTMKVTSMKLEKFVKTQNLDITGGLIKPSESEE